jgi:multiple sugar transport system substrate-binding protein
MHPNFLHEYGNRDALLNLSQLVKSGQIDLSHFPTGIIDSGKIGNAIYMITLGNSAPGTNYNPVMFKQAGVDLPTNTWTWDDFMQTAIGLSETLGEDVYGSTDHGGWVEALETFVRQRGKTLFDGEALGFDKEDLAAHWRVWEELQSARAIPPPELSAEFGPGHEDSMLVKRIVAMHFMFGNQHKLYQAHIDDELALAVLPRGISPEAPPGDILGGAYISLAANTEYVDEGAAFINWFVNDPEVTKIYNAEHGPPGSTEMQVVVNPQLGPADQRLAQLMRVIGPTASLPSIRPPGGAEVQALFSRLYNEIAFKQMTVEQAVNAFFDEAEVLLSK